MENYEEALFEEITPNEDNSTEECTVVCTYMYGYCSEAEGWGTTYCPEWGSALPNDDDDDD